MRRKRGLSGQNGISTKHITAGTALKANSMGHRASVPVNIHTHTPGHVPVVFIHPCNKKHDHATVNIHEAQTCTLLGFHCSLFLLLLLRSPARSLGFSILGEIFAYVTVF